MKARVIWSALILSGVILAAPVTPSLAQSGSGVSAAKESVAHLSKRTTHHTRAHPRKHRYWRHRGGRHPHYGSRRIRH